MFFFSDTLTLFVYFLDIVSYIKFYGYIVTSQRNGSMSIPT